MPAGSWAGGPRARRAQASCSMRWSRPCTIDDRSIAAGSCIIAIGGANTSLSNTPNAWLKLASSLLSAASEIPMTTLSPKPSTVSTRPRGSIGADHGAASRPSSSRRWNGATGSTTGGSWSPSATYRRPKPSNATTPCWNNRPWRHNLNQMASGKPGAVQIALIAYVKAVPFAHPSSHKKAAPFGAAQTLQTTSSLPVLVHVLRHLEMVLQGRQGFAGPVLQLGVFAALRVTLEEGHRILVRTDLHRIIFAGEVF